MRPLPRADGDIGLVTRDHSIATLLLPDSAVPVHCLIGGKWTTFRAFSELAADHVLAALGKRRKVSTAGLAIGGGRGFPRDPEARLRYVQDLARAGRMTTERAETLLGRYGTRAECYVMTLGGGRETMLASLPDFAVQELRHIAATERIGSLDDLLYRRTLIAMTGRDRPDVRAEVAAVLADVPVREIA